VVIRLIRQKGKVKYGPIKL